MKEHGTPREDVISSLKRAKGIDCPYDRILSSMCTYPHEIAIEAHKLFIESNIGDSGLFLGTKELEEGVISMMGELLGNPKAHGYVTTGGTEANIQAIRAARSTYERERPNIIVPESAHFSFDKISDILGVKIKKATLDDQLRVDIQCVERSIDDQTIAIIGIAGTTEFGQIDPIVDLAEIASSNGIFLHVDAAFGGLVIPFLDEKYNFDFRVDGVSSISVDPHKMGMSTIPSGTLLFREEEHLKRLAIPTPYLSTKCQYSLTGTRSGGAVAATYAVLRHLGYEGLRENVQRCMKLTKMIVDAVESFDVRPVIDPVMNVVAFDVPEVERVIAGLRAKGWKVSITRQPKALRLVIMPHMRKEVIEVFINDFKEVIKKIRSNCTH